MSIVQSIAEVVSFVGAVIYFAVGIHYGFKSFGVFNNEMLRSNYCIAACVCGFVGAILLVLFMALESVGV